MHSYLIRAYIDKAVYYNKNDKLMFYRQWFEAELL